ncbi:MAG TPA: type II secretion system secretin GspD [Rubrivivax sp.]|nr:type II secretion system secretin GspD [Rubrivivax sp.]
MNRPHKTGARGATLALFAALTWTGVQAPLWAQTPTVRSRAPVTVNFVNADIEAVTRAFAAMIERPILVDPRVRGTMTVYSEQPQSVRDAYLSYLAALRGLGFAVVESGGILKLVPEADGKLQTGTVSVGDASDKPIRGDQIITQIFTLRHESPNNLVAVLRPLISANNTINANVGSNSLVITDYAENLQRIAKIIAALDQSADTGLEIVPLQHAVAADLAPLVQRLGDGGPAAGTPGVPAGRAGGVTVVADSRSNSLLIRAANPARLATLRATIASLDRPSAMGGIGGNLWVVHLKNADATRLASVVRAAFGAIGGGAGGGGAGASAPAARTAVGTGTGTGAGSAAATTPVATVAEPSTGGFIQVDPASNSLVITAPEPLYKQVRALIDQLDTRRAQVYIESLIVELAGSDAAEAGFQWQSLFGESGDKYGIVTGTNFDNPAGPSIIDINVGAAQGQVNLGSGLNVGLLKAYNGIVSLAAIARFLQTQANVNIVSTPNLITLDNEEAKIVVGENVPFITGQFTNTGTAGAAINPFQTIERQDVGVTLRIRPQIGEGGAVRMTVFQEQSSVKADTAAGTTNAGPSTSKRSIEGTVVVDDGQILVLGGLIEDRYINTRSKVPLLGDLPVLGALFRSESRERRRTNLIVFLRPIVMRDAESANRFSADRYEQIRGRQQASQPSPSVVLPINDSAVLEPKAQGVIPTLPTDSSAVPPPAPRPPQDTTAPAAMGGEGSPGQPTAP